MLSVNFFCNISSYDILTYITKNYIALIYYAKIVHLLCQFQMILNLKRLDDYDSLTDWIRPLARGLPIYSLTDS
jgi:hypothetical protein